MGMSEKTYAFTIIDNRRDSVRYPEFFDRLRENGCVVLDSASELNKSRKLHWHGIVTIPKDVYRKGLCPVGFHMCLKNMYDKEGWEQYYKKDKPDDDPETDDNEMMAKLTNLFDQYKDFPRKEDPSFTKYLEKYNLNNFLNS